eukprot:25567-Amphidinium_carterae.1
MPHGGPIGDLNTVRVWQLRLAARKHNWPLAEATWEVALRKGWAWPHSQLASNLGSALHLCKGVADFDSGLATQALRQLKLDGQSQKDSVKTALNAALGGVWHEGRFHAEFGVGDFCVRCGEAVEDLGHIVHQSPAWNAERREVGIPAFALEAPPYVKFNGLLPAPKRHEPALVSRLGVHIVIVSGCPSRG